MLSLFDDLRVHGHREIAESARLTELVGRPPQVPAVSEEDMPEVLSESQAQQAKVQVQLIFRAASSTPPRRSARSCALLPTPSYPPTSLRVHSPPRPPPLLGGLGFRALRALCALRALLPACTTSTPPLV